MSVVEKKPFKSASRVTPRTISFEKLRERGNALREAVSRRAYSLFEGRKKAGAAPDPQGDWIQAEGGLVHGIDVAVLEDGDYVIVRADMNGIPPEHLQVCTADQSLFLSGEIDDSSVEEDCDGMISTRSLKWIQRELALPAVVDLADMESSYEGGVLSLRLHKAHATGRDVTTRRVDSSSAST